MTLNRGCCRFFSYLKNTAKPMPLSRIRANPDSCGQDRETIHQGNHGRAVDERARHVELLSLRGRATPPSGSVNPRMMTSSTTGMWNTNTAAPAELLGDPAAGERPAGKPQVHRRNGQAQHFPAFFRRINGRQDGDAGAEQHRRAHALQSPAQDQQQRRLGQ